MIDHLKPYPEYKDSGLPWLGSLTLRAHLTHAQPFYTSQTLIRTACCTLLKASFNNDHPVSAPAGPQ